MRARNWFILWLLLGAVALAGALVYVVWFQPLGGKAEIALRRGLADDDVWDRLVGVMSQYFALERIEKQASEDTGVIYTGWADRAAGRELEGKQVRALVLLDRKARKVRILLEAVRSDGKPLRIDPNDSLFRVVRTQIAYAVGNPPTPVPT